VAILLLIALAELGCQKKAAGPPPRYAFLRFENLSGDASLDWTGRAASEILPVSLAGALDGPVLNADGVERLAPALGVRSATAPGISSEHTQAVAAGANRIVSGYVERVGGEIRVVATEEDVANGAALQVDSAEDPSYLGALGKLAREISPKARPLPTTNDNVVRLFATALDSAPETAEQDLEQAARLDPDFGPAWLALARIEISRRDLSGASQVIDEARRHKLDALTAANLDLEDATLKNEPPIERVAVERRIATLSPADIALLRNVAQNEIEAGEFAAGAADWKKATDASPDDPAVWNSLGYARSYAGDYPGALAALQEYARLRPADANPLDSMGDLNFSFRKFSQAAASYLQASAKDPAFQSYGDLYKASWAKFRAGDKAGADALFAKFRDARTKAHDPLIALPAADWLYRTGRPEEGVKMLRQAVAAAGQTQLRPDGYTQLAIWDLLAGDRAKARKDAAAAGTAVSAPLLIVRFASLPSAPAAEWDARADRMLPGPAMAALRPLALGYALLLDGKRDAASQVWDQVMAQTRATDFFVPAIGSRLRGKQLEHPLLPDPGAFNPFLALLDKL
jgi:tetratricopeptide (TPR) repeat protein